MSSRIIKESTVSLDVTNSEDAVTEDGGSGKGKRSKKKSCGNGAGSCKPKADSEDEADL
jgi:hypothetical protein